MATVSDFPFDPIANPTWNDVLTSVVSGFPGQTYSPVLDTLKFDSSITIQPLETPAQIGAVWSNSVDTFMRVAWPAIVQILTGVGGVAFLDLTDVDEATYAGHEGDFVVVNVVPDGLEFAITRTPDRILDGVTDGDGTKRWLIDADITDSVETREPTPTGILTWGTPGMSVFSATTVRFQAGTGVKITKTGLTTDRADITWILQDIVVASIGTRGGTFFTVNAAGTVQQYTSEPSRAVLDAEPFLGIAIHDGIAIDRVIPAPTIAADMAQLLFDEISATGTVKLTAGGDVDEKSTFQSVFGQSDVFVPGINFTVASSPNVKSYIAQDPGVFDAVFQDGQVDVADTSTYIKSYESAPGVLTALTGNDAVIHKIILLADGTHQVQYGNVLYNNFAAAKDGLLNDLVENPLNPLANAIGILLAVAVMGNLVSDWTLDNAEIILIGGGGGGGTGAATPALGDLTDVTLTTPVEGSSINFDGTSDWVDGRAPAQFIFQFDGNVSPATDVANRAIIFAEKFFPIEVRIDVKTAPTTTALDVDVNINGSTVFPGAVPQIGIGLFTATSATNAAALVNGDSITIDIDGGDSVWEDLTVHLRGHPTLT